MVKILMLGTPTLTNGIRISGQFDFILGSTAHQVS